MDVNECQGKRIEDIQELCAKGELKRLNKKVTDFSDCYALARFCPKETWDTAESYVKFALVSNMLFLIIASIAYIQG